MFSELQATYHASRYWSRDTTLHQMYCEAETNLYDDMCEDFSLVLAASDDVCGVLGAPCQFTLSYEDFSSLVSHLSTPDGTYLHAPTEANISLVAFTPDSQVAFYNKAHESKNRNNNKLYCSTVSDSCVSLDAYLGSNLQIRRVPAEGEREEKTGLEACAWRMVVRQYSHYYSRCSNGQSEGRPATSETRRAGCRFVFASSS